MELFELKEVVFLQGQQIRRVHQNLRIQNEVGVGLEVVHGSFVPTLEIFIFKQTRLTFLTRSSLILVFRHLQETNWETYFQNSKEFEEFRILLNLAAAFFEA